MLTTIAPIANRPTKPNIDNNSTRTDGCFTDRIAAIAARIVTVRTMIPYKVHCSTSGPQEVINAQYAILAFCCELFG